MGGIVFPYRQRIWQSHAFPVRVSCCIPLGSAARSWGIYTYWDAGCPAFVIFALSAPHKERLASISMQGRHAKNTQGGQSFRERARTAAQQASKKGSTVSFADTFRETRGNGRRRQRPDSKPRKPRKMNPVKKAVNNWCNRLLGVVSEGSFDQEE